MRGLRPLFFPSLLFSAWLGFNPIFSLAEDWPKYRHDIRNTGVSLETTIGSSNVGTLALKWKFNTGGWVTASPAVATVNGTSMAFVGSWNGRFYALNAVTGQEVWSYQVDSTPYCSACMIGSSADVTNGIVYFGADNAFLYALNAATGAVVWKVQLGDPTQGYAIWSSPSVYNGVVYVGLASHGDNPCVVGHVVALNASTGQINWNFQTLDESTCPGGTNCVGAGVWSSPAIYSHLVVGTGNPGSTCSPSTPNAAHYPDSILALNLSTGALVSSYQAVGNDNSDLDFGSSPAIGFEGAGYMGHAPYEVAVEGSKNGTVYTMNTATGALMNSYGIDGSEIIGSPALEQHQQCGGRSCSFYFAVYTTTTGGHLNRYPSTGGFNVSIPSSYSAPAEIQDVVLFGAVDNALHAASTASGAALWTFTTGGEIDSGPAISNGRVYFGSRDGYLYCVSPNGQ